MLRTFARMKACFMLGSALAFFLSAAFPETAYAARAQIENRTAQPYLGAIVMDADTGMIIFADNPDAVGYPASVLKLMDLLVVLEAVKAGNVSLTNTVTVTAEAARIGGSQVYLKEHEQFSVDELLYALMVQSANDAATALAIHVAGSKDGFVQKMNALAQKLGMRNTAFHSVHGLPPSAGQQADVSTARDLAKLARALLAHPDALRYTSTIERPFRTTPLFVMRNHNSLLSTFPGCDGMKTGYFRLAGYSIVATAKRDGRRVIAAVLGCPDKKLRDQKAAELLALGFSKLPPLPTAAPAPAAAPAAATNTGPAAVPAQAKRHTLAVIVVAGGIVLILAITGLYFRQRRQAGQTTLPR